MPTGVETDINTFNRISPEQLEAERRCMRQLEMMEARLFSLEIDRQARQLEAEEPRLKYMSPGEIIEEDEIRRATCKLCGELCKSEAHMRQHKGMLRCRKKQAENKGETFVPESQQPIHCDICGKSVQQRRWKQHIDSNAHKLNVLKKDGRAFHCPICDKQCKGARPKRMLKDHLTRPIHQKKLTPTLNRESHDAICKLHGFKINTDELLKKIQVV